MKALTYNNRIIIKERTDIMTKESYLQALENLLKKHLSKSEINDILRDYGEYFDDGRRQNKTDTEISAKLGDPEIIAQQFIEELGADNKESKTEMIDQMLHSVKEGTEKAFTTLKKETTKTFQHASDKMASVRQAESQKSSSIKSDIKQGTSTIFSLIKSIFVFCIFAFLQFFFTVFFYGFGIVAAIFFVCCGIVGILCLGLSLTFLPHLLSLAIIFASIALLAFALLIVLFIIFILKWNIQLIKNYFSKNRTR